MIIIRRAHGRKFGFQSMLLLGDYGGSSCKVKWSLVGCVTVNAVVPVYRINREFKTEASNCVTDLNTLPTLIYLRNIQST